MSVVLNQESNKPITSTPESIEDAKKKVDICRIYVDESIEKKIILDELSAEDNSAPNGNDASYGNKNILGTEFPVIRIGEFVPTPSQIAKLKIDNFDKIPSILLKLTLLTDNFRSKNMPKDGDIISIFISTKSETIAPIRADFIITNVMQKNTKIGIDVTLTGNMFIPGFDADTTFGTIGTSKNAFIDAAKHFGLGFATDDSDDTNDMQTWICYNMPCINYLNNVISHTWKDETSFYDWWIDEHYNINFININKMLLTNTKDIDITANSINVNGDFDSPQDHSQKNTKATNKVFSNVPEYSSGVFFVTKWNVTNNSSQISLDNGVEIKTNEFMHNDNVYLSNENPLLSLSNVPSYDPTKTDNHIILRGRTEYNKSTAPESAQARANYNFKDIYVKHPWCGISYVMNDSDSDTNDSNKWGGNVNKNYTRAVFHNRINLVELEKMYIDIEVNGLCTQVMRGEVVPLGLKRNEGTQTTTNNDEQAGRSDRFFSGFYYVQGMSYEYTHGKNAKFKTKLRLTRREWPIPVDYMKPNE